jgi:hypothetical protein
MSAKYVDPATAGEPPAIVQSVAALRMMSMAHDTVNHAELTLIESVIDNGWTWERLGSVYGDRTKQAMQQHYRRRGGERNWREHPAADRDAVRKAVYGVILNFRATDEALTRTMREAVWNERDPEREAARRRSWVERFNDSTEAVNGLVNNRIGHRMSTIDLPMVIGEQLSLHADHVEIDRATVDDLRTQIDQLIAGIEQHRDTVEETVAELRRRRAELDG